MYLHNCSAGISRDSRPLQGHWPAAGDDKQLAPRRQIFPGRWRRSEKLSLLHQIPRAKPEHSTALTRWPCVDRPATPLLLAARTDAAAVAVGQHHGQQRSGLHSSQCFWWPTHLGCDIAAVAWPPTTTQRPKCWCCRHCPTPPPPLRASARLWPGYHSPLRPAAAGGGRSRWRRPRETRVFRRLRRPWRTWQPGPGCWCSCRRAGCPPGSDHKVGSQPGRRRMQRRRRMRTVDSPPRRGLRTAAAAAEKWRRRRRERGSRPPRPAQSCARFRSTSVCRST